MPQLCVGDKMPNFDVVTAKEVRTTLFNLCSGKPTVLLALRHIGCPMTRYDVQQFIENYSEFEEKDVCLLILLQSKPVNVLEVLGKNPLPFEIICDTTQDIYRKLDIAPAKNKLQFMKASAETKEKKYIAKKAGFTKGNVEGNPLQFPAFFYFDKFRVITECHYAKYLCDMPTVKQFTDNI